ncbi:hypothetical protein EY920_17280 [Citrobacter braakii]|nr:hypothetical protein EY920_17280 [Citrobacter braakii]
MASRFHASPDISWGGSPPSARQRLSAQCPENGGCCRIRLQTTGIKKPACAGFFTKRQQAGD